MKKASHRKKSKEKHRRSGSRADSPVWDTLDVGDLEGADEKFLQKRRQLLQRELRLQLKKEKGPKSSKIIKIDKKATRARSTSSEASDSSSSSSSSSSVTSKRPIYKKRKSSSRSASRSPSRDRSNFKTSFKNKNDGKKKNRNSRSDVKLSSHSKKSPSPEQHHRRSTPSRKKVVSRSKPRVQTKQKSPSPRRIPRVKDWRPARPRSSERKSNHSSRSRHGGLEEGGKIFPLKSSAYVKEMKDSIRRKSPIERNRDEKEKRTREQKSRQRDQAERRERERETERGKRDVERQKERESALQRSRDRQRERDRLDRDKRKEVERKSELKNELPSLLDIRTEVPRDAARLRWPERRRRPEDGFDFRRAPVDDKAVSDERKGRKKADFAAVWDDRGRDVRERSSDWCRDADISRKPQINLPLIKSAEDHKNENWRNQYSHRPSIDAILNVETVDAQTGPSGDVQGRQNICNTSNNDAGHEISGDLEEVFSDISDDADDILNQDDVTSTPSALSKPPAIAPPLLVPSPVPTSEILFDSRRAIIECLAERGLDFEEISDEELEEDAKIGRGIMDVLGADWASLLARPTVVEKKCEDGSARKRWRPENIFGRFGISRNLVDGTFCQRHLNNIFDPIQGLKKEEPDDEVKHEFEEKSNMETNTCTEDSRENNCENNITEYSVKLLHPCAGVHSFLQKFNSSSPVTELLRNRSKLGLSANYDLSIRRVSNNLPGREHHQLTQCDESIYEAACALFKSVAA